MSHTSTATVVALLTMLVLTPEPARAAAPLNVFGEFRKISDNFSKAAQGPKDPAYKKALAERNEALTKLAIEAEKASAPNHAVLSNIYMTLGRYDAAIGKFELILKAPPVDSLFYYRARLVDAYLKLNRLDDALAASQATATSDVTIAGAKDYLQSYPYSLKQMIVALQKAGRAKEGAELLDLSTAQWGKVESMIAALPPAEKNMYASSDLRTTFDALRRDLKLPAVAGSPRQMASPKPATPPQPSTAKPARPLDVQAEYGKIVGKFYRAAKDPMDPAYPAAEAERDAALQQLVAQAEQMKTDNHDNMASAYVMLKRYDDAARHVEFLVKAAPESFETRQRQVDALVGAERWDDAAAAIRQTTAIKLSLANAKDYLKHFPKTAGQIIPALVEAKRAQEAEELLTSCDAQFKTLHDQVAKLSDFQRNVEYPTSDCATLLYELRAKHWPTTVTASSIATLGAGKSPGMNAARSASKLGTRIGDLLKAHPIEPPYFGSDENAEYQAKVKARREAFGKLASDAEAEKITDHEDLMFIYAAADRQSDALREVELLLAANPGRYDKHESIMRSLVELTDPDPALAFLDRWLDADVTFESLHDWLLPLGLNGAGVRDVINRLADARRDNDAKSALQRIDAKVRNLNQQYQAAAVKPAGLPAATVGNAIVTVDGVRAGLELRLNSRGRSGSLARQKAVSETHRAFLINSRTFDRDNNPEYQGKVKSRREAFVRLAQQAEAEHSTEHELLLYIYAAADRKADALRELNFVLAADPKKYFRHDTIMAALAQLSDPQPALDFLNQWIDADVTLDNYSEWAELLGSDNLGGIHAVMDRLGDTGREAEAGAALKRIEAKVAALRSQFDAASKKPMHLSPSDFAMAGNAINTCDAVLKTWNDFHFNNTIGALTFRTPLDVVFEQERLAKRLAFQSGSHQAGPERERAQANYLDGLKQLAQAAEGVEPVNHSALTKLYAELKQPDDVIRHGRYLLDEQPDSFFVPTNLSLMLDRMGRADDAKALRDRALSRAINPVETKNFLVNSAAQVKSMCESAVARRDLEEADSIRRRWEAQLVALRTKVSGPKADTKAIATAFEPLLKVVAELKNYVALAHEREAIFDKPYPPVTASVWLNGGPLSAAQVRGKVLVIQFWYFLPGSNSMQKLNELLTEVGEQGLVVVGVWPRSNLVWQASEGKPQFSAKPDLTPAEADAEVTRFAEHFQWKSPLAIQSDGKLADSYGIKEFQFPATVVVGRQGLVRHIIFGWSPAAQEQIRDAIVDALAKAP